MKTKGFPGQKWLTFFCLLLFFGPFASFSQDFVRFNKGNGYSVKTIGIKTDSPNSLSAQAGFRQRLKAKTDSAVEYLLLMNSFQKHLKGARAFNSIINGMELIGYPLFLVGITSEYEALTIGGFGIGFSAMEMSKYSPVPLTKARRALLRLRPVWNDADNYNRLLRQVSAAAYLSYASMSFAFIAQGIFAIGVLTPGEYSNGWFISSYACAGLSLGLALASTVVTSKAIRTFRGHGIILGASISGQGITASLRLP